MRDLAQYIEQIVEPTFKEYQRNSQSLRHAYLACVTIFHAVDRVAFALGKKRKLMRDKWGEESLAFRLVDTITHHFKHVESHDEVASQKSGKQGIPISHALGFGDEGDELDYHNVYFLIRDALTFVKRKAAKDN